MLASFSSSVLSPSCLLMYAWKVDMTIRDGDVKTQNERFSESKRSKVKPHCQVKVEAGDRPPHNTSQSRFVQSFKRCRCQMNREIGMHLGYKREEL